MKCKGQTPHEMTKGHKFCAECGAAAEEEKHDGLEKAVCSGCQTEGTGKHCAECGEVLVKSDAAARELDDALKALGDLAKANTALPADLDPEKNPDGLTEERIAALLKGVTGEGDGTAADANEPVDALPVLALLLKAHNALSGMVLAIGKELRQVRKELAIVAKADSARAVAERLVLKSVTDTLKEWGDRPQGPRSRTARVTVTDRSLADPNAGGKGNAGGFDRATYLAKAHVASDKGLISVDDLIKAETWINSGATPEAITEIDPGFGAKLARAVAAVTQ